jgi:hypothetical protein
LFHRATRHLCRQRLGYQLSHHIIFSQFC